MKRCFLFLLICCILFLGLGEAWAVEEGSGSKEPQALTLYAQSAVLMDGDSGRILYGKGQEIVRPMASTTKIMTCILALELGSLDDNVTASAEAASQPKVHLGVRKGEEYRLKDLLYALMLESYNDAAVMIAESVGGSVEGFAALMNEKAEELGCTDTYFITPNGLDGVKTDENGEEHIHSTTAADLARIMRYCVSQSPKRKEFLEITGTQNYSFTDTGKKRFFQCTNHNALLHSMEGVISGKTGFTGGAGYSYVGALRSEGRTYIISLLGCGWPPHKTYKWSDARQLYRYGMEHYRLVDVFEPKILSPVPVRGGICWEEGEHGSQVELSWGMAGEETGLPVLLREGEQVEVTERIPSFLNAPVEAGQQVGSVTYSLDGLVLKTYPLYAKGAVEEMTWRKAGAHVLECFLISPII